MDGPIRVQDGLFRRIPGGGRGSSKVRLSVLPNPASHLTGPRHYQDAYSTLLLMFASITTLPPRTKRWAEAKVLADCIDIKVRSAWIVNITVLTAASDMQALLI